MKALLWSHFDEGEVQDIHNIKGSFNDAKLKRSIDLNVNAGKRHVCNSFFDDNGDRIKNWVLFELSSWKPS